MKKRLLSALLAVCMVMTMAPAAFAAEGDTLQAKIDADTSGAIQLEKDYTENIVIGEGKDITLDLNGHTISSNSADTIYVKMGATLKIVDTSESASGKVDNQKHGHAAIFNNGTVTLEGGTYDRSAETAPKLSELHRILFGTGFEDAHNALADVEATAKCFWKLKELGIIKS